MASPTSAELKLSLIKQTNKQTNKFYIHGNEIKSHMKETNRLLSQMCEWDFGNRKGLIPSKSVILGDRDHSIRSKQCLPSLVCATDSKGSKCDKLLKRELSRALDLSQISHALSYRIFS